MPGPLRWLLRRALTLAPDEASGDRRGFQQGTPEVRGRLDGIGRAVLDGHHAAIAASDDQELFERLESVESEQRGFAYEGAAMGLALMDLMTFRGLRRWRAFRDRYAERHDYMMHVGAGLAYARMRRGLELPVRDADPLLGALVADGYGFHEGFFKAERALHAPRPPSRIAGYAARAYDQGLGRSLWFVCSTNPESIARTIRGLPSERHGDLWSGVGLACAYAGGLGRADISSLIALSEGHAAELAQGAAFAAEARARAGNPAPHTRLACEILCGRDDGKAAALARTIREKLPLEPDGGAYEEWRRRLRAAFAHEAVST